MKTHTPTHSTFDQISALKNGTTPATPKTEEAGDSTKSFSQFLEQSHADALSKMQTQLINQFFKPNVKITEDAAAKPKVEPKPKVEASKSKNLPQKATDKPKECSKDSESKVNENDDDSQDQSDSVKDDDQSDEDKTESKSKDSTSPMQLQNSQQPKPLVQNKVVSEKVNSGSDLKGDTTADAGKTQPEALTFGQIAATHGVDIKGPKGKAEKETPETDDALPEELVAKDAKPVLDDALKHLQIDAKQQHSNSSTKDQNSDMLNQQGTSANPKLDIKVIDFTDNPNQLAALTQASEKTAEAKDSGGKNLTSIVQSTVNSDLAQPIVPTSVILSAMAAAESAGKGDLGIKDALKSYMRESGNNQTNAIAEVDSNPKGQGATGTSNAASLQQSKAPQATVPVRMTQLIERVQKAVESQTPPNPKQITFQVEPHSLGVVSVNMSWSADGWNVNWSVTQNEVREWLNQQMPSLQQNASLGTPIVWHPPTLTPNQWSMAQQQQGQAHSHERNVDRLLAQDDKEEGDRVKPVSNEYWA